MINIDLRPDIETKPDYRLLMQYGFVLLASLISVYIAISMYESKLNNEYDLLQSQIRAKQQEIEQLKTELKTVDVLNAKIAEIKNRGSQISVLNEGRKEPVVLLDQLQQQHLERMWLEAVKFQGNNAQITGWAVDHGIIAEYARRLRQVQQKIELEQIDLEFYDPRKVLMPDAFGGEGGENETTENGEKSDNTEKSDETKQTEQTSNASGSTSADNTASQSGDAPGPKDDVTQKDLPPPPKEKTKPSLSENKENIKNLSRIFGLKFNQVHIKQTTEEMIQNVPMQKFEISFMIERVVEGL